MPFMDEKTKKDHQKKIVAPAVITVIFLLYFCGFFAVCTMMPIPLAGKLFFGLLPLFLAGVLIFVFVERIKEIRSGEEDDLSNY